MPHPIYPDGGYFIRPAAVSARVMTALTVDGPTPPRLARWLRLTT